MANVTQAIQVEHHPSAERLKELDVWIWGIWTKEVSTFPWEFDIKETCYFLEGDVLVTPEGGKPVQIGKGDLVKFAAGVKCTWEVRQAVKKHYFFG
ncbi:MAG: cupin domain-containing protein [Limnothrix sp. RL_2_0]|nr:cupin domain-containing protein [Limnothrix sp. RL_2_0]